MRDARPAGLSASCSDRTNLQASHREIATVHQGRLARLAQRDLFVWVQAQLGKATQELLSPNFDSSVYLLNFCVDVASSSCVL